MSSTLDLEVSTVGSTKVLTLVGELDDSTSGLVHALLQHLCDDGTTDVHIDAWRLVVHDSAAHELGLAADQVSEQGMRTTVAH